MQKALDFKVRMERVDALIARGSSIAAAVAEVGVTIPAYALWLADHDHRIPVNVERLTHLQNENVRLRKTLAKLSLELTAVRRARQLPDAFSRAA